MDLTFMLSEYDSGKSESFRLIGHSSNVAIRSFGKGEFAKRAFKKNF